MSQVSIIANSSIQTMTSVEIAGLTGKRHDQVLRTARDLAAQGITQSVECKYQSVDGGRGYPQHQLTKRDSLVLVARLSPEFTGRIVDRWIELEAGIPAFAVPTTLSSALRLAAEQADTIEQQATKIALDAPKVAFAETIRSIDGVCHIEKVAKTLGYGRNKFFKQLRADSVLMRSNLPYQKYLDRDYFTVVEQEPYTDKEGVKHPTFTAMVTGAGQVFLARKYSNEMGAAA